MTGMWVAVTAEYNDATFSHRARGRGYPVAEDRAARHFGLLLDEAATCVRSGLAGWLGPQYSGQSDRPLSEHEKLRAIEKIIERASAEGDGWLEDIRAVLTR